jgi:hypothetical protein
MVPVPFRSTRTPFFNSYSVEKVLIYKYTRLEELFLQVPDELVFAVNLYEPDIIPGVVFNLLAVF